MCVCARIPVCLSVCLSVCGGLEGGGVCGSLHFGVYVVHMFLYRMSYMYSVYVCIDLWYMSAGLCCL